MRHGVIGLIVAGVLIVPNISWAQIGVFSPQQQGALMIYQQQIRNQARLRQQQQLMQIQRQFVNQRSDIERNRRVQQRQIDQILNPVDPYSPNASPDDIRRSRRGTAVFGDAHFGSPMFNRLDPYYDYQFIARRNRPVPLGITAGSNSPTGGGFGNFIIGGGFGGFAVPF
ncbi:hypothetical protein K2X85_02925 [bacterium]|jgi:hypothetical protein|nr:hypothetical protein [bacterium]